MTANNLKKMLADANAVIDTIAVHDALELVGNPDTVFVDIRETVERQQEGTITGAVHAPRGFLEFIADPQGPMHNDIFFSGKRFVLFCATGGRSTLATKTLLDLGIQNVAHIAGGFAAWKAAGGSVASSS